MAETKVRIENKSAHVKHLALANGQTLAVPPTDDGAPGTTITLTSDDELKAFDAALEQPVIKEWVDSGELVVNRGGGQVQQPSGQPVQQPQQPQQPPSATGKTDPKVGEQKKGQ